MPSDEGLGESRVCKADLKQVFKTVLRYWLSYTDTSHNYESPRQDMKLGRFG